MKADTVRLLDDDGEGGGGGGGDGGSPAAAAPGAGAGAGPGKQTRFQTVASLVNTMMGTTIVALPFGVAQAGVGSGLLIIALLGGCSCYTALILSRAGGRGEEFSVVVARYLGRRAQAVAWAVSLAIIAGAAVVYHILMAETLFQLVITLGDAAGPAAAAAVARGWRREYAALVPWVLFPVSNQRDLSAIVKFNSVGAAFLWYTILFVLAHGARALSRGAALLAPSALPPGPPASGAFLPDGRLALVLGGSSNVAGLGGMMMLSFFLHNCFQPIVRNAANPRAVGADMRTAYAVAGGLYAAVGVIGYAGLADASAPASCAYAPGGDSPCALSPNFLAAFGTSLGDAWGAYALSARVSLLAQLFTVFPLLLLIIRVQVWGVLRGTPWPGAGAVAGLNFCVMAATFAAGAVDAKVSEVLRFVGAVGGIVIVYAVPLAIHAAQRRLPPARGGGGGGGGAARGAGGGGGGGGADDDDALLRAGLLVGGSGGGASVQFDGDGGGEEGGEGGEGEATDTGGGAAPASAPVPLPPSLLMDVVDAAVFAVGATFTLVQFIPQVGGS